MLSEFEALSVLYEGFGDKHVYADDKPHVVLGNKYLAIRSFAKGQGFSGVTEWLKQKGIYVDIERNMRSLSEDRPASNTPADITDFVFRSHALLGDACLPQEARNQLLKRANEIFECIADRTEYPSKEEQKILVLATIQHLMEWNRNECDNEADAFWPYIYRRFGHKPDNDSGLTQYIYNVFCSAIRNALEKENRFFAPEGTQRYYTTMMLHALAPIQSIENLFEILLYFYTQDLEFMYTPRDPGFSSLVTCIAARWDREIEKDEVLSVRSAALASGLRILFLERPRFMRQFCENIVCKMDALIRNQAEGLLSDASHLDQLLLRWYQKKSSSTRSELMRERTGVKGERVVLAAEAVRVQYAIEGEMVALVVPRIRLEETGREYPVLRIHQAGLELAQIEMEVYGSRLCWTTQRMVIPLADHGVDFNLLSDIRLTIDYGGKCVLDTDEKLHRTYLIFDENGREIPRQSIGMGQIYLFGGDALSIDTAENVPCHQLDHPGQLLEIQLNGTGGVCVNGLEIYAPPGGKRQFRHYASIQKSVGVSALREGLRFSIYPGAFSLCIELPSGANSLEYHISIDGRRQPLADLCGEGDSHFAFDAPSAPESVHLIQMIEFVSGSVVYEYRYTVLRAFGYILDKPLYFEDGSLIELVVQYGGKLCQIELALDEDGDSVTLRPDGLEFDLVLDVPLVRCRFLDRNAFSIRETLWVRDIPRSAFLTATYPTGWTCHAVIGSKPVPRTPDSASYEIGNFLQTYRPSEVVQSLGLLLRGDRGVRAQFFVSEIAFHEHFRSAPLSIENDKLRWSVQGNFVGDANARFSVQLDVPDKGEPFVYSLMNRDEDVERNFPYEFGEFHYRVFIIRESMFSRVREELLYEGTFILGNPNLWRFLNKCVILMKAKCWVCEKNAYENVMLLDSAGWLTDFRYLGMSIPNGENEELPEFEATLSFFDRTGRRFLAFNSDENSGECEWINPVHVWPVSDSLLIMLTASEEAVYVDRQLRTIANRKPERYISPSQLRERLRIPDYFEFSFDTMEERVSNV